MSKKQKTHIVKKFNREDNSFEITYSLLDDIDSALKIGIAHLFILWQGGWNCPEFSQYYLLIQDRIYDINPNDYEYFLKTIREINMMIYKHKIDLPSDLKNIEDKCHILYKLTTNDKKTFKNTY